MFTQRERDFLSNRLPISATEIFVKKMEEADNVMNGTYMKEISFADHPDTKLAIRVRAREVRVKMHEKRVADGLAEPARVYKPTGNEILIARPSELSPIIPASVRQELEESLKSEEYPQEGSECSGISPVPPILPLVRSSAEPCSETESKEQLP